MLNYILKNKKKILGMLGLLALIFVTFFLFQRGGNYNEGNAFLTNTEDRKEASGLEVGEESAYCDVEESALANDSLNQKMSSSEGNLIENQKMIIHWDISMQTENYEKSLNKIYDLVQNAGGYIESQNEYGQEGSKRYTSFVLRIPDHQGDVCIQKIEELGTLFSKSKSSENVTLQYVDTESRLKSFRTELDALNKLMKSAGKMEDIITIRSEIQNVSYQIDSYESQLRSLQNAVNYMTIEVDIQEVTIERMQSPGILDEIIENFTQACFTLLAFGRFIVVGLVGYSLYIILIILFIILIRKIFKKQKRKREENKG